MGRFLRRYTELPFLFDFLHTKELALPRPKAWEDGNDAFYLERYAEKAKVAAVYALCLTEASETFHHWRLFSNGSSGVCIEFDRNRFILHMNQVEGLRAERVRYRTLDSLRKEPPQAAELPFLKRSAFRDEYEFRLVLPCQEPTGDLIRIPVPLELVNRVTLSPWLPAAVVNHVKMAIKSIEGAEQVDVYRSSLIKNEEWKQFAEEAV